LCKAILDNNEIRAYEIHKKKIEKINHQIEKTKLKKLQMAAGVTNHGVSMVGSPLPPCSAESGSKKPPVGNTLYPTGVNPSALETSHLNTSNIG